MRSTVDILDVLDAQLRKLAKEQNISYKEAINRAVAAGLPSLDSSARRRAPRYRVRAKACGFRAGVDTAHLNRIADEIDDEREFAGAK